jgi:DNA-binding NtrC family response regulator
MGSRILIVDDDPDSLLGLSEALQCHLQDVVVQTAPAAETALTTLSLTPFDLVISDIRMPGMDGMQLLREVRTRMPDTAVILMTGCDSALRVEALRAGATAFCEKPIVVEDLLRVIRNTFQDMQLIKQIRDGNRRSLLRVAGRRLAG